MRANRPRHRRLSPSLIANVIPKEADVKSKLVSGWLKREPSPGTEYGYLPIWDWNGRMFQLVDNYADGKRVTPVEVADYYFNDVDTLYGPMPFFAMAKWSEALDMIDGLGRDFVIDTLNFIATGRRRFSHPVWRNLMDQEVRDVQNLKSSYEPNPLGIEKCYEKVLGNITPKQFFLLWVGQRDGLNDLIFSYQTFLEPWVLEEPPLNVFVVDTN